MKTNWDQVGDQVRAHGFGQHDANWVGFYDYFKGIGIDISLLEGLIILTESCGGYWFFENIVIFIDRHSILQRNSLGQLHCDDGIALGYSDGFSVYALNGVRVPKEIVMTSELDPQLILTEKNVEVRREIIRKIGAERILQELGGECLDKFNFNINGDEIPYELYRVKGVTPLLLKMRNPSLRVWHIELIRESGKPYLTHSIKTCKDALKWRFKGKEFDPQQLT